MPKQGVKDSLSDILVYLRGRGLSQDEILDLVYKLLIEKRVVNALENIRRQGIGTEQILSQLRGLLSVQAEAIIPLSIFKNSALGALESIVKYLRENRMLSFRQIASLTNRNPVALAVTYRNAKGKLPKVFVEMASPYSIPASILHDRKLSVLENIVTYLKQSYGLTNHQIALLLNRDDRTVWTVNQRAKKKMTKQRRPAV